MNNIRQYILEKKLPYFTLYVDLDGVLTNMEKAYRDLTGKDIDKVEKFWIPLVGNKSFWSEMEWQPDGKKLWQAIKKYDPTILSTPIQDKASIIGKNEWIDRNLGKETYRLIKFNKWTYAQPKDILIDDMAKNIDKWKEKQGYGILHINTKTTLMQLNKILNNF